MIILPQIMLKVPPERYRLSMELLDLTLDTPAENLALEEALIKWAEEGQRECLRLWESRQYFAVLGAGSPYRTEVNHAQCDERSIPVLRRCSGGGTVLQGPGCLNYTLLLDLQARPEMASITGSNQYVLGHIVRAIKNAAATGSTLNPSIQGYSDLTDGPLKFSGNCQRRRKRFILFHGTILHSFDLPLISTCLGTPEKMPDYRENREHKSFITNITIDADRLKQAIAAVWGATRPMTDWPAVETKKLAGTRYADQQWIQSI